MMIRVRAIAIALLSGCAHNATDAGAKDAGAAGGDASTQSPSDASSVAPSDAPAECNSVTGRSQPVPLCTAAAPCMHPIPLLGTTQITAPTEAPTCATSSASHPSFDDGPPIAFTPPDGVTRYACAFHPTGASASSPRPLLVFLHGSGGSAQDVYNYTLLRAKATSYDLTGDAARPGFHLVAVNARNLHWPSSDPQDGPKHDFYDRDLASPSSNPDIANLDRVIDELADDPAVDADRIYVTGWSNGADFAELYAAARHVTPTPGGHRIAAAAVYSGGDPFNSEPDLPDPSCQLSPYPQTTVPILIESRACDLYACSDAQAAAFAAGGNPIEPGGVVADWMTVLAGSAGDPNGHWLILTSIATLTTTCTAAQSCSYTDAAADHLRWPDGTSTLDGGRDHEPELLDFLRAHPLQ